MAEYSRVEEETLKGKSARLSDWPLCKTIRRFVSSDADYFFDAENLQGAMIEDCKKNCDCKIGLWIPQPGEKDADNWIIIGEDRDSLSEILYADKLDEE